MDQVNGFCQHFLMLYCIKFCVIIQHRASLRLIWLGV
nr:MAG TPA: hypothetical protein [Caudoviricetes sp.]